MTSFEVGMGSGYGAALAREMVGSKGKVVTVEIDEVTYDFGKRNLERLCYEDVVAILGDGSLGYEQGSPYDKISITAVCRELPRELVDQLKVNGKMIGPIGSSQFQELVLFQKVSVTDVRTKYLENVFFVPLKGKYSPVY